ncbi:MAG: class I SAM-dependent methyltransferase [Candidatus Sumerlaeia bacterium]|nr:class I SAM-dependent methyltransferase [Candidatus Sumerlaeia bacterium]
MTSSIKQSALTDEDFWSKRNKRVKEETIIPSKPVWLKKLEPILKEESHIKSVLEIGVYPGKMLLYLAENTDLECHGVDFDEQISKLMKMENFRKHNISLVHHDLFSWAPGRTFDFVYSHGFIEHFTAPKEVVQKHWDLVSPNGILLLTVPAHTPAQYWMRRSMYKPEYWQEARRTHNAAVMKLKPLSDLTTSLPGSKIVAAYHCGEFRASFGFGPQALKWWVKGVLPFMRPFERLTQKFGWSSPMFSPTACVVIKKEA